MRYRTPAALEMAVKTAAINSPMDTNRAITGFYFHRFLCRVFSKSESGFVLKGGQSILARTVDARYTRDIDLLSKDTDIQVAVAELRELASINLDDYVRFEYECIEPIKAEDEYRSGANVSFSVWVGSKFVQMISVDLVVDVGENISAEAVTPKDRIDIEGIQVFDYMVYGIEDALADKLFGIVEKHNGRPSSRVKDLVDILVYASTCSVDCDELARRLQRESLLRKVVLPNSFAVPPMWHKNYLAMFKKLCRQTGIADAFWDMSLAEELAGRLYNPALASEGHDAIWNPENLCWEE